MMNKKLNTTSKQKYNAPIIDVEELVKNDILTLSGPDNRNDINWAQMGAYSDLFSSIFEE